jgi:hypothetical protein
MSSRPDFWVIGVSRLLMNQRKGNHLAGKK